jgi:NNP family nitrate/nitrite transporter-like MFS transporter
MLQSELFTDTYFCERTSTMNATITQWTPEDPLFWEKTGKKIAYTNLIISTGCLALSFVVWVFWSILAVKINSYGFHLSKAELFSLIAIPGLVGASLRILYSFTIPIFGGRNWTTFSTATLLIPTIGLLICLQNPNTSYTTFILLAIFCGLGGGNFSSSMANISLFFPKRLQGSALGINGGIGNLGVSIFQLFAPLALSLPFYGHAINGIYLSSAIAIWIPFIVIFTILAGWKMVNLPTSIKPLQQFRVFKQANMYLVTILYFCAFGTFIGCSVAFPLVTKLQFKEIEVVKYAFIGPMVGSLTRVVGGILADKLGGKKISILAFIVMGCATLGIIYFTQSDQHDFLPYLWMFLLLFAFSGVANGSIFQLIGVVFPGGEKAPALGLSAAIAAYASYLLPQLFSWSLASFNSPDSAFFILIACYILSVFILFSCYRKVA